MSRDARTAIVGGTFTPIHNGHRALLHEAFQTASHDGTGDGHVIVGLTATALAERTRSDPAHAELLGPFADRRAALEAELDATGEAYTASHEVIELTDAHGPAATRPDVDALGVSPEAEGSTVRLRTQPAAAGGRVPAGRDTHPAFRRRRGRRAQQQHPDPERRDRRTRPAAGVRWVRQSRSFGGRPRRRPGRSWTPPPARIRGPTAPRGSGQPLTSRYPLRRRIAARRSARSGSPARR